MKLKALIRPFLPPCLHCERPSQNFLCSSCFEDLKFQGACVLCGHHPLAQSLKICRPCELRPRNWEESFVAFHYEGGFRRWLLTFKNGGKPEVLRELKSEWLPPIRADDYEAIVSASSDPVQNRQRLYDPSELLAKRLGDLWKLPVLSNAFNRQAFLQPQKELSLEIRRRFLKKTVRLSSSLQARRFSRLILVDDVMTSGATLEVHSALLKPISHGLDVFCLSRVVRKA